MFRIKNLSISRNFPSPSKKFNFSLPKSLRFGFIENSLTFFRNLFIDYKAVFRDTIQDIRSRPLRASFIGSILMAGAYCIRHNPDENYFVMQLIESNNKLSRVQDSIRNKNSLNYIHEIFQKNDKKLLRHQSLGFFSLIYEADYSPENDLYQTQCTYLKPSWKTILLEKIIDIGFLDKFWYMDYRMKDYDINEEEWKHLENKKSWV